MFLFMLFGSACSDILVVAFEFWVIEFQFGNKNKMV